MRLCIYSLIIFGLASPGLSQNAVAETAAPLLAEQPKLRGLLRQEMRALQEALVTMSRALPQGDWQTLATTAGKVHDSFIFQQQLTEEDRKTLRQALPEGFINLDKALHLRASKLQQAANERNAELSLFHFSRLMEACITCHSSYATHRFPVLKEQAGTVPGH